MLLFVLASKLEAAASCINKKASSNYSLKLKAAVWAVKKNVSITHTKVPLRLFIQIGTRAV